MSLRQRLGAALGDGSREPPPLELLAGSETHGRHLLRAMAAVSAVFVPITAVTIAFMPRVTKYDVPTAIAMVATLVAGAVALRVPDRYLRVALALYAALCASTLTLVAYDLHRYNNPLVPCMVVAVAPVAFCFFPRRIAVLMVAGASALYALHLALSPWQDYPVARWVLVTAVTVLVGALMDWFAGRVSTLAAAERRAKHELAETNRHKSQFLANMSHELRTPLNAVIGFSDVLSEELFGELNEKQREYVDDIRSSGHHLLALINDVLDLSKVEAGRMELEPCWFELNDALHACAAMFREQAARHGVDLVVSLAPSVGSIEADERKVRQVVVNLLSNAVKFTPRGGHVELSSVRRNGDVTIAVRDTGPGIEPEEQAHIFEEFRQAASARDGRGPGTGLGLALAKRFIELHGGSIAVDSAPGRGATFRVRLPCTGERRGIS